VKRNEKLSLYKDEVFRELKVKKLLDAKNEKKIFSYFMMESIVHIVFQIPL